MTAPFPLQPPKSFDGLSPRELGLSYERTVDDGEEVPPSGGPGAIPDVDLTIADGGEVTVMTAQPSAETDYWPRSPWFDSRAFNQIRVVVDDVETAGHTTARVIAKYKATVGGSFATPGAAAAEVAAPISSTGPQKTSAWVTLDPAAIGDRLWHAYGVGGNAVITPAAGGVHLQFRQGTAVRPDRAPTGILNFEWLVTEGSGQIVANKLSGGVTADLILGDTTSADGRDPSWASLPRRLTTLGFASVDHDYAHYDSMPSLAAGCAIVFYCDLVSLGTDVKYLCGVRLNTADDHYITISNVDRLVRAIVTEDDGAGGVTRTATSTTDIQNGDECVVCLNHTGATLQVGVNGVFEDTVACGPAKEPGGRFFAIGAGDMPTTGENGPDSWAFGDAYVYTGGGISADQFAALYAAMKANPYTGLP